MILCHQLLHHPHRLSNHLYRMREMLQKHLVVYRRKTLGKIKPHRHKKKVWVKALFWPDYSSFSQPFPLLFTMYRSSKNKLLKYEVELRAVADVEHFMVHQIAFVDMLLMLETVIVATLKFVNRLVQLLHQLRLQHPAPRVVADLPLGYPME